MSDPFEDEARELIRAKLADHPDPGVRAINALCDPPEDAVKRLAAALREKAMKGPKH